MQSLCQRLLSYLMRLVWFKQTQVDSFVRVMYSGRPSRLIWSSYRQKDNFMDYAPVVSCIHMMNRASTFRNTSYIQHYFVQLHVLPVYLTLIMSSGPGALNRDDDGTVVSLLLQSVYLCIYLFSSSSFLHILVNKRRCFCYSHLAVLSTFL